MRPDLGFDQDDLRRLEAIQIAPDHRREIQRRVGDAQAGNISGGGDGVTGGGAGGEHEAAPGFAA